MFFLNTNCKNIYNTDKLVLFNRFCPNRAYLAANESKSGIRGNEVQKHKIRTSIVTCVNCDGSNVLPVLVQTKNTNCFRDPMFTRLKDNYWSQANGWIDSTGFRR